MLRTFALTALVVLGAGLAASKVEAGPFHNRRYQTSQPVQQAATTQTQQTYAGSGTWNNVWPYYASSNRNSVGASYSPAAGLRQGQWFGTFGLRPADARARGAY